MHDIIENSHGHVHLSAVMRDLHPVMLARDVDLAGLNASIDQLRQSLRQFEEMVTAFNRQLESDYRSRSEEHTSELQSRGHLVCRLLLEKKKYYSRCEQGKDASIAVTPAEIRLY